MENINAGDRVLKVKSSSDWVTNQLLPILNRLQVLFLSIFHLSLLLEVRFNWAILLIEVVHILQEKKKLDNYLFGAHAQLIKEKCKNLGIHIILSKCRQHQLNLPWMSSNHWKNCFKLKTSNKRRRNLLAQDL